MATAVRRTTLLLVVCTVAALCLLPQAAGAAPAAAQPELGPLSPAFVEALHDPLITVGLGRVPSPVQVSVGTAAQARAARASLPSAYDLRAVGRLTPVKDQDNWSTCWAFANIAALESKLMSATPAPDPVPDYSEDNLVGRSGYGPIFPGGHDAYDFGGYDFMAIAYFARWAGPVNESDDPYDGSPQTGPVQKHVQGVTMIPGRSSALDNDLVKTLVMQNGALSVGMYMDQSSDLYLDEATNSYYCPTARGENHGVTIVGWDDSYPAGNFGARYTPAGDGAFLVRNTWGDSFGDGGYFWVSYYDGSFARDQGLGGLGGMSSYSEVQDVGNYAREYQYDKLGVTAHVGYGTRRVWGANRFTAAQTQSIAAVSFYTLSSSTSYEVWAGRSLKTLTRRASGVAALPGYATVPLDTPLGVTAGKRFVVAVKLTTPSRGHQLAIEYPRTSIGATRVTAGKGQSYISRNGSTWTDLTTTYRRSNVCLKAFAQ